MDTGEPLSIRERALIHGLNKDESRELWRISLLRNSFELANSTHPDKNKIFADLCKTYYENFNNPKIKKKPVKKIKKYKSLDEIDKEFFDIVNKNKQKRGM